MVDIAGVNAIAHLLDHVQAEIEAELTYRAPSALGRSERYLRLVDLEDMLLAQVDCGYAAA